VTPAPATLRSGELASSFARDGYAIIERLLEPTALSEITREVEQLAAGPLKPTCSRPNNTLLPLRWNDRVVELILEPPSRVERIRNAVEGDDFRWISGYISIKEARSAALPWHQDWWCWDHPVSFESAAPQVALLCYLSRTDAEHGALRLVPRSHYDYTDLHAQLAAADAANSKLPLGDEQEQLTLAVDAGDAVVIDYRLLHGTHPNPAGSRRDCVLLSFAPTWRDLPEDVRGHLISHPAQPTAGERPPAWLRDLRPTFTGVRRDLPLNRVRPRAGVS
jgi:hypothetical protein